MESVMRGQVRSARRVLRGGSFNNTAENVRCAYRNTNNPDNRNNNRGFRVVCATLLCSLPGMPDGICTEGGRPHLPLSGRGTNNKNGGTCSWPWTCHRHDTGE
ncbi:MAG: SUMF1/EgtB/PvdO family nonheme iron enzyme [Halieaceae bacterium]|nr:SUMF1/EgtB/PvdO family nonheme iron enzyme [Halieaceae bacterium]